MEEILKNPFYLKNYIPILSFLIGTLLLISLALTGIDELLFIGLMYIFAAILINMIYIIYLFINFYNQNIGSDETLSRLGVTVLNIPITILYIYIVFKVIL